jgi:acetoin utilization deacetylase AcuC-like enzyme
MPAPPAAPDRFGGTPLAGGGAGARFWHYDHLPLPVPPGHRYPRARLTQVRERLLAEGTLSASELTPGEAAGWDTLALVHTEEYLRQLQDGTLPPAARREIGLPFSPELVARARGAVGATLAATAHALSGGAAAVIGGGTHHAYPGRGAGYCVLNDIAVAIRRGQRDGWLERAAIVDLDVHQGNGNAAIFARDRSVFTFSVHGAANWPYRKEQSDLDVALPDGTGDDEYLAAVKPALASLLERFRPDAVFYQAGVDPLASDRLGRLALTHEGLRQRDEWVLSRCAEAGCPVVVTLGGGYAQPIEDSVEAHANTLRALARLWPAPMARAGEPG